MEIAILRSKTDLRITTYLNVKRLVRMGEAFSRLETEDARERCRSIMAGLGDNLREFRAKNKFYEVV